MGVAIVREDLLVQVVLYEPQRPAVTWDESHVSIMGRILLSRRSVVSVDNCAREQQGIARGNSHITHVQCARISLATNVTLFGTKGTLQC